MNYSIEQLVFHLKKTKLDFCLIVHACTQAHRHTDTQTFQIAQTTKYEKIKHTYNHNEKHVGIYICDSGVEKSFLNNTHTQHKSHEGMLDKFESTSEHFLDERHHQ